MRDPATAPVPAAASGRPDAIHPEPPTSPSQLLGWPSIRLLAVLAAFVALAVAAALDAGFHRFHPRRGCGGFTAEVAA